MNTQRVVIMTKPNQLDQETRLSIQAELQKRHAEGCSSVQLADRAGISQSAAYVAMTKGQVGYVNGIKLLEYFGCTAESLKAKHGYASPGAKSKLDSFSGATVEPPAMSYVPQSYERERPVRTAPTQPPPAPPAPSSKPDSSVVDDDVAAVIAEMGFDYTTALILQVIKDDLGQMSNYQMTLASALIFKTTNQIRKLHEQETSSTESMGGPGGRAERTSSGVIPRAATHTR